MNQNLLTPEIIKLFITPIQSIQHLKDWVYFFLDIDLPSTHIYEYSNSSPAEAIYEAYCAYRDDLCVQTPGYIWLASRDSGKTLSASILNILLMVHFKAQIAHLAAIKAQSEKCLQYINYFIRKIKPYLEAINRHVITESKTKIQILNEDSTISYVNVIVANLAGSNSEHCPVATYDEIDTLTSQGVVGYKEAKLIPTRYKGRGPLVVKFSTRKFAAGIFEEEISKIHETGEKLLQWNIVDVTEHCPDSRSKKSSNKQIIRYIGKSLPLANISVSEYKKLTKDQQVKYEKIKAYEGCATCPLLAVCKGKLADRPETDKGGLFKTIDYTISLFKRIDPLMAESQLLCLKPSTSGLVYPKFSTDNIINIVDAYNVISGEQIESISFSKFIDYLHTHDIPIYAGVDWGFRHAFAIIIGALTPDRYFYVLDSISKSGLEFLEQLKIALLIRDKYKIKKWFCDTSMPSFITTFRKNRMICPHFIKSVQDGIESVRSYIVDASGVRRLKILNTPNNQFLIEGMHKHHYKINSSGKITSEIDDDDYADMLDALRYIAQNIFNVKKNILRTELDNIKMQNTNSYKNAIEEQLKSDLYKQQMQDIVNSAVNVQTPKTVKSKSGSIVLYTGGDIDDTDKNE